MTGSRLLPVQRRRQIADLAEESGALRVAELASRFGVTDETIRRDLSALEEAGILTRQHGGALSTGMGFETPYGRRGREQNAAKEAIARAALSFINDGSTIILDSGTTIRALVALLRTKRDLLVITNGVSHVPELLANPSTTVVLTGGSVRRASLGAVGDLAVATLQTLQADHAFLATQGFSAGTGVTYPSFEEVAVKRAMIAAGVEATLLADGSKCGRTSMVRVAPLDQFNRLITSAPIPGEELDKIRQLGLEVIVAESESLEQERGAA
jgi:DeoR family transcriptional regulator, fructose operon transcriptional repressor